MLAAAAAKLDVEPSETGGDGSCSSSSGSRRRLLGEMEPRRASSSAEGSDAEAGTAGGGIVDGVEDVVASVLGRGGGGIRRDGIVPANASADVIVGESSETPPNAVAAPHVGDSIGRS